MFTFNIIINNKHYKSFKPIGAYGKAIQAIQAKQAQSDFVQTIAKHLFKLSKTVFHFVQFLFVLLRFLPKFQINFYLWDIIEHNTI